jgi:hypothetical protein
VKLKSGFLLDVRHGLVHYQGFRNRLASLWTERVPTEAAKYHEPAQKVNKKE